MKGAKAMPGKDPLCEKCKPTIGLVAVVDGATGKKIGMRVNGDDIAKSITEQNRLRSLSSGVDAWEAHEVFRKSNAKEAATEAPKPKYLAPAAMPAFIARYEASAKAQGKTESQSGALEYAKAEGYKGARPLIKKHYALRAPGRPIKAK